MDAFASGVAGVAFGAYIGFCLFVFVPLIFIVIAAKRDAERERLQEIEWRAEDKAKRERLAEISRLFRESQHKGAGR